MVNAKPRPSAPKPVAASIDDNVFGPPPLLDGEDKAAYFGLLEKVKATVKPRDVLEQISMRDFVDITWEILRLRRLREPLILAGHGTALVDMLTPRYGHLTACELRDAWLNGDREKRAEVRAYMDDRGLTVDDIHARAIAAKIDILERIDRMTAQAEHRRRLIIGELDRRRDTLARRLREAAEVIDAEVQSDAGDPPAIVRAS